MRNSALYTKDERTRFTLLLNSELLEKIRVDAEKNKRSTSKQIEFIIEQYYFLYSTE